MDDIFTKTPELLGILPDNKFYQKHPKYYTLFSIFHAIYNFGITIIPIVVGVMYIQNGNYPKAQVPCEIMGMVKTMIYAVIVSLSVLYQNVLYPHDYIEMKTKFREIDSILERCGCALNKRWMWMRFIIFIIVYILYVIYTYHVNSHTTHKIYVLVISWIHFNFILEIILAWKWLELIRERLFLFNGLLVSLEDTQCTFVKDAVSIDDLIDIQRRLVKIVNVFNLLMGISVALRSLMFMIEVLGVVLRIAQGVDEDFWLAVIDSLIDGLGWCVFVIKSQHVIDEGNMSQNYCLDAMSCWLRRDDKSEEEKVLLSHLCQRVSAQVPQFTAARFYSVDFAAFFMIVNMTTGYVIIVVQFAVK